jgi:hypothetical protein
VVSGLGGDGEGNYGDGLTMAAKMVMERWTNYGREDGDGEKVWMSQQHNRRVSLTRGWSFVFSAMQHSPPELLVG